MLLKVLLLVVVALAVGSPVTAVGERKLLAPDRWTDGYGSYSAYDSATNTYTSLYFWYQASDNLDQGWFSTYVFNYNSFSYAYASCSLNQVVRQGINQNALFGNCYIYNPNSIAAFDGCTQFSTSLKGEPNLQDKCMYKDSWSYVDYNTGETVLITAKSNTKSMPASGKVEGVGCTATVPLVNGYIYEAMSLQKIKIKN